MSTPCERKSNFWSSGHQPDAWSWMNWRSFTISLKHEPIKSTYFIHSEAPQHEDSVRDLAVTLDTRLTFQTHINNILCRANRTLGVMMWTFLSEHLTKFDHKALMAVYCANVRSVLEFSSVMWNGAAKSHTERLEREQRKSLKWLSTHVQVAPPTLDYNQLLAHFSLRSVKTRQTQHD